MGKSQSHTEKPHKELLLFLNKEHKVKAYALLEEIKAPSESFMLFCQNIEKASGLVDSLKCAFDFLRTCVETDFARMSKEFWQVKQLCLELFKEPLEQSFRYPLWQEFIELLNQAKFAEDLLSENSAFSLEQFELALKGLQSEVSSAEELEKSQWHLIDQVGFDGSQSSMEEFLRALNQEISTTQAHLVNYNNLAVRYRSLKEEIVEASLRAKDRRQLFDKLKAIRVLLFPRRKELIKKVSHLYLEEVFRFVESARAQLKEGKKARPSHAIRTELKALQKLAKGLTLLPEAFKKARAQLAALWEELSTLDTERKAKFLEKKEQLVSNAKAIEEKIAHIEKSAEGKSLEEIKQLIREGKRHLRAQPLLKEDSAAFDQRLRALEAPFIEEEERQMQKRIEARKKQELEKQKALEIIESNLNEALSKDEPFELESYQKELKVLELSRKERVHFEGLFERAQRQLQEQKLKSLGNDAQAQIALFNERKADLVSKLEELKKEKGTKSLDFERALFIEEAIASAKDELHKIHKELERLMR